MIENIRWWSSKICLTLNVIIGIGLVVVDFLDALREQILVCWLDSVFLVTTMISIKTLLSRDELWQNGRSVSVLRVVLLDLNHRYSTEYVLPVREQ